MGKFSVDSIARPIDPSRIEQGGTQTYLKEFSGAALPSEDQIVILPIDLLDDFPDHPFGVRDDEDMANLTESIREYGVLEPIIVIPDDHGRYTIVSGHRRKHGSIQAGKTDIPCVIRNMTQDESVIAMVDANLRREKILPSERATAYRMKLEAIKRQGKRTDLTSSQIETKLRSDEELARETGESRAQIQRYIRLAKYLDKSLLPLVDANKIGFSVAVELSYLPPEIQKAFINALGGKKPVMKQVTALKKHLASKDPPEDAIEKAIWQQLEIKFEPPPAEPPIEDVPPVDQTTDGQPSTGEKALSEGVGIKFEPPSEDGGSDHTMTDAEFETIVGFLMKAADSCKHIVKNTEPITDTTLRYLLCGLQWVRPDTTVEEARAYYKKERNRL